jgi:5'-nucleotidase
MAHILLTNDDGIDAPGLRALIHTMRPLARVSVFAPDHNWSAAGHTKTMHKPLRADRYPLVFDHDEGEPGAKNQVEAYTTTGAPSDCVALALLGVLPEKPDLVVSGINQGANLGHDVTYSGTVAAAMEAVISGRPAVAISLDSGESQGFGFAARVAASVVGRVLQKGLPSGTFLNVNVPGCLPDEIAGLRITRLGRRVYRDVLVQRQDPRGRSYYWIGGEPPTGYRDEGTDIWAVANRYVSVTPIHLDMTAHELIPRLREWDFDL